MSRGVGCKEVMHMEEVCPLNKIKEVGVEFEKYA